jgi:hypothetical protein
MIKQWTWMKCVSIQVTSFFIAKSIPHFETQGEGLLTIKIFMKLNNKLIHNCSKILVYVVWSQGGDLNWYLKFWSFWFEFYGNIFPKTLKSNRGVSYIGNPPLETSHFSKKGGGGWRYNMFKQWWIFFQTSQLNNGEFGYIL